MTIRAATSADTGAIHRTQLRRLASVPLAA